MTKQQLLCELNNIAGIVKDVDLYDDMAWKHCEWAANDLKKLITQVEAVVALEDEGAMATSNPTKTLVVEPPHSPGDIIEAVHQGVIVRGVVVERIGYTYFRIANGIERDFWVGLGQIIGRVS